MKRLVQFAATCVIALLAGLPVGAGLTCAMHMVADGSTCPMGMSGMGPDCPMAQEMGAAGCAQDCCNAHMAVVATPAAVRVKPKLASRAESMALIPLEATAAKTAATELAGPPRSSTPPRYILNRVFRI
jgi:hypothetical protein